MSEKAPQQDQYAELKSDFRTGVRVSETALAKMTVPSYDVYVGVTSNGVVSTGLTEMDTQYFG